MMKHACKECWDPVDREGEDLCDWCQMTPEQRDARQRRNWWQLALAVWLLVLALALSRSGNP